MFMLRSLVLIAVVGWPAASFAGSAEELQAFLNGLSTLKADFRQTLYDENLYKLEEYRGEFYLKRPNHFRWDYRQPEAQLIVADGRRVWVYDRDLAQVTVRPIDVALGATPAMLLSSSAPVAQNFEVQELSPDRGLEWVGLTPLNKDSGFTHIRVGLRNGVLQRMELTDNFGQLTIVEFEDLRSNVPVDASAFEFEPPAGVDVIRSD